jgi:DME family drug/metabolite transporter
MGWGRRRAGVAAVDGDRAACLLGGLAGAYLIAFPDRTTVSVHGLGPALLALAAAALWGTGTVLGHGLAAKIPFAELTALRLGFGLAASSAGLGYQGGGALAHLNAKAVLALVLLAGLPSLLAYYRGLQGTPAASATIRELTFPLATLIVGYLAFHTLLSTTHWLGVAFPAHAKG